MRILYNWLWTLVVGQGTTAGALVLLDRRMRKKENQKLLSIDLLKADVKKKLLSTCALRVEETYNKLLEKPNPVEIMQKMVR